MNFLKNYQQFSGNNYVSFSKLSKQLKKALEFKQAKQTLSYWSKNILNLDKI